jgi:hypothetical protein
MVSRLVAVHVKVTGGLWQLDKRALHRRVDDDLAAQTRRAGEPRGHVKHVILRCTLSSGRERTAETHLFFGRLREAVKHVFLENDVARAARHGSFTRSLHVNVVALRNVQEVLADLAGDRHAFATRLDKGDGDVWRRRIKVSSPSTVESNGPVGAAHHLGAPEGAGDCPRQPHRECSAGRAGRSSHTPKAGSMSNKTYLRYKPSHVMGLITSPQCNVVSDGKGHFAASGAVELVQVWNVRRGALHASLYEEGCDSLVTHLCMAPDGDTLAAGYVFCRA